MEPLKDSYHLKNLGVTAPPEQYRRQRLSDKWQPNGFDRYQYQKWLLAQMGVLGGTYDQFGANDDRYQPIGKLEEDFPRGGIPD